MNSHTKTAFTTPQERSTLSALLEQPQFRLYIRALFNRTGIHAVIQPSNNPRGDAFAEGYRAAGLLIFNQCQEAAPSRLINILESPQ